MTWRVQSQFNTAAAISHLQSAKSHQSCIRLLYSSFLFYPVLSCCCHPEFFSQDQKINLSSGHLSDLLIWVSGTSDTRGDKISEISERCGYNTRFWRTILLLELPHVKGQKHICQCALLTVVSLLVKGPEIRSHEQTWSWKNTETTVTSAANKETSLQLSLKKKKGVLLTGSFVNRTSDTYELTENDSSMKRLKLINKKVWGQYLSWRDTVFPPYVRVSIFLFGLSLPWKRRGKRRTGRPDVTAKQIILFGKLHS